MKTTRTGFRSGRQKDERRARRKDKGRTRGSSDARPTISPLGGTMDDALLDEIYRAVSEFDPAGPWSEVAHMILPLLRRAHHPYPPDAAPLHIHVPPGVWAGFGIDFGPAFSHVTAAQLDRWGIDTAELLGTALANLERRAVEDPPLVDRMVPDGVETIAIQAQGWGSALILAPDRLRLILGDAERLLLTPVRNTLLALPADVDADHAFRLWAALADGSHDELDVEPLRWNGRTVTTLEGGAGLPN